MIDEPGYKAYYINDFIKLFIGVWPEYRKTFCFLLKTFQIGNDLLHPFYQQIEFLTKRRILCSIKFRKTLEQLKKESGITEYDLINLIRCFMILSLDGTLSETLGNLSITLDSNKYGFLYVCKNKENENVFCLYTVTDNNIKIVTLTTERNFYDTYGSIMESLQETEKAILRLNKGIGIRKDGETFSKYVSGVWPEYRTLLSEESNLILDHRKMIYKLGEAKDKEVILPPIRKIICDVHFRKKLEYVKKYYFLSQKELLLLVRLIIVIAMFGDIPQAYYKHEVSLKKSNNALLKEYCYFTIRKNAEQNIIVLYKAEEDWLFLANIGNYKSIIIGE